MVEKKRKSPLSETHPELVEEADGWDPGQISKGSDKILPWVCKQNHRWQAAVSSRAAKRPRGCPYCAGQRLLRGENDLQTLFPEIAAQAYGWDPRDYFATSNKQVTWKCAHGHLWVSNIRDRTSKSTGCTVCSGRSVLIGFNDLASQYPEIAKEADGWDPSKFTPGNSKRFSWKCAKGHVWKTSINNRTFHGNNCPVCAGKIVVEGFNDLASEFPSIAAQADGWDPKTVGSGSNRRVSWVDEFGHRWITSVFERTGGETNCPYCANKKVLAGFNDLLTLYPQIAVQADGWNPATVVPGNSSRKLKWKCSNGHGWTTTSNARVQGTGCPTCANYGFDPNLDGYLYLITHPNWMMLQIGITNYPDNRLKSHKKLGWEVLELRGPMDGHLTHHWETAILRMLKAKGADLSNETIAGEFDGYSEAWSKSTFQVRSIKELMHLTEEYEEDK